MKYLGPPQSGSQANTTASHNRAGQYLRNRRKPVSPTRTPKQGVLRGKFGAASALWQTLPSDLQSAWTAFAAGYPVVDALGQTVVLTGQQYFIGLQTSLLNAGQDFNTAVPTNLLTPPVDAPLVIAQSSGYIGVSVASMTDGDFNLVALSKVLSNGRNFNKSFSQFAVLTPGDNVQDVGVPYAAQFGVPQSGRKVFARFKEVNSSGMSGPNLIQQVGVVDSAYAGVPVLVETSGGSLQSTLAGSGTDSQTLFIEAAFGQGYVAFGTVAGVAGVVSFSEVPAGKRAYTRHVAAGLFGQASNLVTVHG